MFDSSNESLSKTEGSFLRVFIFDEIFFSRNSRANFLLDFLKIRQNVPSIFPELLFELLNTENFKRKAC